MRANLHGPCSALVDRFLVLCVRVCFGVAKERRRTKTNVKLMVSLRKSVAKDSI